MLTRSDALRVSGELERIMRYVIKRHLYEREREREREKTTSGEKYWGPRYVFFSLLTQKLVVLSRIKAIQFNETLFTCMLHDRIQLTMHHAVENVSIDPINLQWP